MTLILMFGFPVVIYLSLCSLPRAPGSLYTIGIVFLLAQAARWLGLLAEGGGVVLTLAQISIVMAGLVQGLRLLALPAETSRGRYLALVVGGALLGAAVLRNSLGA